MIVAAEPKHYAAHSIPESGLNTAPAHLGPRDLETLFLPTFKAAVMEAGARGIMAAYSEIDGIPNACNEDLLYDHLRTVRRRFSATHTLISPLRCNVGSTAMGIRRFCALRSGGD
jgi:hypothetical protein